MIHKRLRGTIEGSISRNVSIEDVESSNMDKQRRTLFDYEQPKFVGEEFSVQALTVNANNFSLASPIGMTPNLV